jgi:hypothetical protein
VLSKYDLWNLLYQVAGTDLMLGTLVVYGLAYDNRTIKIVADDHNNEDVHFYTGRQWNTPEIPIPQPCCFLAWSNGLGGVRSKFKN